MANAVVGLASQGPIGRHHDTHISCPIRRKKGEQMLATAACLSATFEGQRATNGGQYQGNYRLLLAVIVHQPNRKLGRKIV
ncbi:hypothetical protein BIW11_04932 [Tropilaelaps mercedesae]|uniref:Uncharacterized protein n=1 Tax=Tropilaelaps mercedesae TaxID=418985 RepID=A0A1V9WZX3_9ACAR|nr:hypothetical protein BIW11_04932 [Tropilaelaps mercedesae]